MTSENVFSICNNIALFGWLLLILLPRNKWTSRIVLGGIIPVLLAIIYTSLIGIHIWGSEGGFSSLSNVAKLFENQWLLLAGWVHYLAFDLFVGSWEVRDSQTLKISHLLVIPCLILTFLFGPFGYLIYQLIKFIAQRRSQQ